MGIKMYQVSSSSIHGKGLFATKPIKKGTLIGRVEGRKTKRNGDYVLWITDKQGFLVQNEMKYINHSSKPNAAYYDDLTVVALKNIKAGDEITHHYQTDFD